MGSTLLSLVTLTLGAKIPLEQFLLLERIGLKGSGARSEIS